MQLLRERPKSPASACSLSASAMFKREALRGGALRLEKDTEGTWPLGPFQPLPPTFYRPIENEK